MTQIGKSSFVMCFSALRCKRPEDSEVKRLLPSLSPIVVCSLCISAMLSINEEMLSAVFSDTVFLNGGGSSLSCLASRWAGSRNSGWSFGVTGSASMSRGVGVYEDFDFGRNMGVASESVDDVGDAC